ncbi:MAG: hypothetical protein AB7O43_21470 [Hyphomicrobiaceae bacterium]
MKARLVVPALAALSLAGLGITASLQAQTAASMSFFVTSVGLGKGADLGGLEGADAHCAALAKAAGSKRKTWKAYLSLAPTADRSKTPPVYVPGVDARDRIGKGPWRNAKGVVVARNVASLHSSKNNINMGTALDEKGRPISGRADAQAKKGPNKHDILTGSDPQGRYSTAGGDTTCGNWTKNSADGSAIVGHHDRAGLNDQRHSLSWNSAHGSRGCTQDNLKSSGGDGLFYCFSPN